MFGLFGRKKVEANLRQGTEVGEMRVTAFDLLFDLGKLSPEFGLQRDDELGFFSFTYHGIPVTAPYVGNVQGLSLRTTLPECNVRCAASTTGRAQAYRCLDHICRTRPGARAYFDPESGNLVVAVESAGFGEQLRADTAIDIALFMLEEAVHAARTFLGLPATPVILARAEQFGGGYHFGEGMKTYATARDAFAAYLVRHLSCEEVSRDGRSVLLRSGPVDYEVMGMGWPSGFMVATTTRGFRRSVQDEGRYVRIQERLAQPVVNPERPGEWSWNFRDPGRTSIAYFQEDGSFVVGQYGFGSPRTDANGAAYELVAQAQSLSVYAMTLLTEELPDELYSDEANRPN
jgi:hypothetical protein